MSDPSLAPTPAKEPVRKDQGPGNILRAAQTFIADTEALEEVLLVSTPVLTAKRDEHIAEIQQLLSQLNLKLVDESPLSYQDMHRLSGIASKLQRGNYLFRGHLLVALVSRFDAFVSNIAREVLYERTEKLAGRTLTYSEAVQSSSIEELKNRFIEEEIDAKMRDSHEEHLKFLSFLADVPLGSDEPTLFADFMELTERRNCHIHSDGRVSSQYRRACEARKVPSDQVPKIGESLDVTVEYFSHARRVLSEMAFKIAQTIVRKVFKGSQGLADIYLNTLGLEMLIEKRWDEALMIFDYGSSLRQGWASSEGRRRDILINKAQALIGQGKTEAAMAAVKSMDWSASHPKYVMAIHLLKREFKKAADQMSIAGIDENDYRKWPLFESFRRTEEFKDAFFALYGHDFDQPTPGDVSEARAVIESDGAAPFAEVEENLLLDEDADYAAPIVEGEENLLLDEDADCAVGDTGGSQGNK